MDDIHLNSTNDESKETEHLIHTILNIFSFITSLIGLSANGIILYVYYRAPKIRDTTMTFIMNLAVADFGTLVVLCFYEMSLFLDLQFRYESFYGCIAIELFVNLFTFASQLFISAATFDRFVAICYCTSYQRIMSKRMVKLLLFGSWVTATILAGFPLYTDQNNFEIYNCLYHLILPDVIYIMYSSMLIVLMFLSLVFQVKILLKAWAIYRDTNFQSETSAAKRKSVLNGKLMGVVTFMFIMCWLPYNITQLQFGSRGEGLNYYLLSITFYFGILNSTLNPFIYAKQRRDFQNESKKLFGCIICWRLDSENHHVQSFREDDIVSSRRKTTNNYTGARTSKLTLQSTTQSRAGNCSMQYSSSLDTPVSKSFSNEGQVVPWTWEQALHSPQQNYQSHPCSSKVRLDGNICSTAKTSGKLHFKVIEIKQMEDDSI